MKKWLLGITCMLMMLGLIFSAGCGRQPASPASDRLEVRNNGTAIQWKYSDETDWHDLVALDELRGSAGENGKDGIDGKDGKDGVNGKNGIDGKDGINGVDGKDGADGRNGKDGIDGADGKDGVNGKDGANGKDGINGKDGADGKDGIDGKDGADGNTPFIGENGNWWIGTTDTGVKAAGIDGEKGDKGDIGEKGEKGDKGDIGEKGDKGDKGDIGEKGDKGDKGDIGEKGEKGDKGDPGQNGSCSGYFYGEANSPRTVLNNSRVNISVYEKINKGGLISSYRNNITLKKGHIYNVCLSGSLEVGSNEFNNSGNYSIQMTDGYDDDLCRELTRIKRDGTKIPYTNDQHSFNFNRMYDASNKDITLQLWFENSAYNTYLGGFRGTITITALD